MKLQNGSPYHFSARDHLAPLPANQKFRGAARKRHRTHFTSQHLEKLEAIFSQTTNPHRELVVQLSTLLSLTDKNISIWFKNRRAKLKRELKTTVEKSERNTFIPSGEVNAHDSQSTKQQNTDIVQNTSYLSQSYSDSKFVSDQCPQNDMVDVEYQLSPLSDHQSQINIQQETRMWINHDYRTDIGVSNSKFGGYMPAFAIPTSNVCGNNYYRQPTCNPHTYDADYPAQSTSENPVGYAGSYNYPVYCTSSPGTASSTSLSPTYDDVSSSSFGSVSYNCTALSPVVSSFS